MNRVTQWPSPGAAVTGSSLALDAPIRPRTVPTMLIQIIAIARRRMGLILAIVAGTVALGVLVTLLMTPRYTASSTLEIARESETFVNVQGAESKATFRDDEFYETQYGLLRAQSLGGRVAADLRLYQDQDFLARTNALRGAVAPDGSRDPAKIGRQEKIRLAGAALLRSVEIVPNRFSRLVEVRYSDTSATRAKQVVDKWSTNFVQMALERRFDATRYARSFLEQRLQQLRTRIDTSERQLVAYAAREGIINLPAASGNGGRGATSSDAERSIVADNLAALNQELNVAAADRIRAEARLGSRRGEVSEALDNSAINLLRQRRAEAAAEYAKLRVQFEAGYPPAQALERQIAQLDLSIAREEGRVGQTLEQTFRSARGRENELRARVSALQTNLLDYRRRSINYEILRREVDTNQQLYDALLQRYKEIGVAGGVGINNVSIIDAAEMPQKPSSPRPLVNLAIALLLGIMLSAAAVAVIEQTDQGIDDPSDVEGALGIPLLGAVPRTGPSIQPLAQIDDRSSLLSEAYLTVQTSLGFTTDHGLPRTIGVTSSRPAEGKSTSSYAIAQSFARATGRVLLIDGDMRSPSLHRMFGESNERGLSNFLAGDNDVLSLIRPTRFESLALMAAGPPPPSASELLSGDRVDALLRQLRETYEHIVIDLPPVMGLADAPLMASRLEGIIFVVEAHATKRAIAHVALDRIHAAKARVFGIIFSKFDAKHTYYGSGYGAAYGYGYGYGDKAPTKQSLWSRLFGMKAK